jgi:hypothetical protein
VTTFSQAEYDARALIKADLVRLFRERANGCLLYGIPITDFSRDELLAALAMATSKIATYPWQSPFA